MGNPACDICENTEYEVRDGHYYCTLCRQQSQELGVVRILEDDALFSLGMRSKTISLGSGRKRKTDGSFVSETNVERWSTVEGYTQILAHWVQQLEDLGLSGVRRQALQIWAKYQQLLGTAFIPRSKRICGDGRRSVVSLSYRDKWNFFDGPAQVPEPLFLNWILRKKRQREEKRSENEEEEDLEDYRAERKKRKRKRRAFYKSFSESFRTEDESAEPGKVSKSDAESDAESAYSSVFGGSGATTIYNLLEDIQSVINDSKGKRPVTVCPKHLDLRQLRAVLTLAVTCTTGSVLTTSDLAYLFSSETLSHASSLSTLPSSYHITMTERQEFMGFKKGLQMISEEDLRFEAYKLASFISLTKDNRLVVSTESTFLSVLERYIKDLSLPSFLFRDIKRTFSNCRLMTLSCTLPGRKYHRRDCAIPCVSVRVLAVLLVTLKVHCGLDGVQEYYYSHAAQTINAENRGPRKYFDMLAWIRLSKLRLDHLISNDFTIREQFRSFKNRGTPAVTLRSMDENRQILERVGRPFEKQARLLEDLRDLVKDFAAEDSPARDPMKTLTPLEDKTRVLLGETKKKKLVEQMTKLLRMPDEWMRLYYRSPEDRKVLGGLPERRVELEKNVRPVLTIPRDVAGRSLKCPILERSEGVPVCSWELEPGSVPIFNKRYWFSCVDLNFEKLKHKYCESDLFNHLQVQPDNYIWILRYFAAYAMVPIHLLEREVINLEDYIQKMDGHFFSGRPKPYRKEERNFRYCDCDKCRGVDAAYPKCSERIV